MKIRFRPNVSTLLVDDVGLPEAVAPGWTPLTTDGIAAGSDANGTYVTPTTSNGAIRLQSTVVSPGIIDVAGPDWRFYSVTYDIGYSTGNLFQVLWTPTGSTTNATLFQDAANSPTGLRTRWFYMYDSQGDSGTFTVKLSGGGKVYQLGDNVAAEHLAEPFSQQVGLPGTGVGVDTTTGSFGLQETDLVVAGTPPLVLTRYYAGHSDRVGAMGWRWRHSFDVVLALSPDGDAVVRFPDGAEEPFDWDPNAQTFTTRDVRVRSTLVKNVDGSYSYTTRGNYTYRFMATLQLYEIEDPNGVDLVLSYDANGRLSTVTGPGPRTLTFAYDPTSGYLTSVTGPGGVDVLYSYDANGDLTSVTNADDEDSTLTYSRHRLTKVEDENDAVLVSVGLDSVNRVVSLADATGEDLEFAWDPAGAVGTTQVEDRRGSGVTTYFFDKWGRTTNVVAPTGEVTGFVYDGEGNLSRWIDTDHRPELVVDAQGTRTKREYDAAGNLLRVVVDETDPNNPTARPYLNLTTDYEYDAQGRLIKTIVDPDDGPAAGPHLNLVTTYGYTNDGLLSSVTVDPTDAGRPGDELNLTTTYYYNSLKQLTHEVDPGSRTTSYTMNLLGEIVQATTDPANDPLNSNPLPGPALALTRRWVYDSAGNLVIAQDPVQYDLDPNYSNGYGTEWFYDDPAHPSLPTRKYDALGRLTRYTYDADGRMTQAIVDALPEAPEQPTGQELRLRTDCIYDVSGRLTKTIVDPTDPNVTGDELNLVTQYLYDAKGLLWKVIVDPTDEAIPGTELNLTTVYTYDADDRLIGKTQPDGAAWTYDYDEVGRLIRTTDPATHVTEYEYDRAGRRTKTTVDPGTGKLNLTTEFTYDNAGRLVQTTDPTGVKTVSVYDRAGRLVSTTLDPADSGTPQQELDITTTYAYTPGGDLASITDALGRVTSYTQDRAGRVTLVTAPGPRSTSMSYDRAGRTVDTVSDDGVVTRNVYDLLGRATAVIVEPDDGVAPAELNLETQFGYDRAGRRTSVTNPRGYATTTAYDDAGRVTSMTDAATPTAGVVSFEYDRGSRVTRVVNARGYGSDFQYDAMGRATQLEDPLDRAQTRVYNGLGQPTQVVDALGNDMRYTYDGANRLTQIAAAGGTVYASFGYDADGRQTAANNYNGNLAYTFDAAGRVTQVSSPQETVGYQYDKLNRRTSMTQQATGGSALTTSYAYEDPSGDLLSITDWNSQATTFQFTDDGRLYSVARPNGVTTLRNYDAAGRLAAISHSDSGGALAEYGYTLDANGNRTQVVVTGSAVANGTETYTYDALDRLTQVSYPTGSATYAYDAGGNRTSVTSGGATTNYIYDDADQLQELRDGANTLLVDLGYDANGNRTEATAGGTTDTFTYDWANRLTQATVAGTAATFSYLADGTRPTKTSGGATTPYLYDRAAGLPQVVDDGATDYVHAPGGLLEEVSASTTWDLTDGLGSVRARADATGGVVGTADWDAFGNLRASTGASGSVGWAGEQRDAETGYIYLRGRYYSPGVGRFLTPDTLAQSAPGTQGFNRYAYALNNPATLTDPSGHSVVEELRKLGQAVAGVFGQMASILDCYLYGSCRLTRKHGGSEGTGVRELSKPLAAKDLMFARWIYPQRPSALSLRKQAQSLDPNTPVRDPARPAQCLGLRGLGPYGSMQLAPTGSIIGDAKGWVDFSTVFFDSCDVDALVAALRPGDDTPERIGEIVAQATGVAIGAAFGGGAGAAAGGIMGYAVGQLIVESLLGSSEEDLEKAKAAIEQANANGLGQGIVILQQRGPGDPGENPVTGTQHPSVLQWAISQPAFESLHFCLGSVDQQVQCAPQFIGPVLPPDPTTNL